MVRRVVVARWAAALLTLVLMYGTLQPVRAEAPATGSADWQLTPLGGPARRRQ